MFPANWKCDAMCNPGKIGKLKYNTRDTIFPLTQEARVQGKTCTASRVENQRERRVV